MSVIKRSFPFFVVLALATLGLVAIGGCKKRGDDGNRMVFHGAHKDDVKTWDPANAYDAISLDVAPSVYETLYQYAYLADTYKLVPLLAADMPKFSKDRLTVTIPIQHGVMFQDDPCFKATHGKGRELKAQDFIYEMKRLALPAIESQGWWIFDGKVKGINDYHDKLVKAAKADLPRLFAEEVEGLKALDDYTIQIKLLKPYPQLIYVLAMTFTAPLAHEQAEAYADERGNLIDHPVGTGPFILKVWDRGRRIELEQNPTYHAEFYPTEGSLDYRKKGLLADAGKKLPFVDRVSIDVIKEDQPRWLNFMKGNEDVVEIPKDNFGQAITNQVNLSPELSGKGIRLNIETGITFYYISFNMKDKLLGSNKALRQAISSAIDRERWIEIFTNGRGKKATSALPPGIRDRPEGSKLRYDFNLAMARELLKKAGYPDGKDLPVISFDMRGADSVNRQMGEFFAQQMSAIGIKLNVIYNTFPAFLEKMKQGNLQVSYAGWGMDYPDPENVYQLVYGPNKSPGPNDSNYDNPVMNKLYEELAVMEPGPKRALVIKKMDDLLQEDCPWALGYYHAEYDLSQPWLLNYRGSELINNRYKYFKVGTEIKKRYLDTK